MKKNLMKVKLDTLELAYIDFVRDKLQQKTGKKPQRDTVITQIINSLDIISKNVGINNLGEALKEVIQKGNKNL